MKYIIFNWKSYLNIAESMNLSNIVSKLPSTKKYKLICSPNNFYNLSLKSRYPKNIYAAQNIDLHGKGASTGSIDIEDLVKRLALFKLRSDVTITNNTNLKIVLTKGKIKNTASIANASLSFLDPRFKNFFCE